MTTAGELGYRKTRSEYIRRVAEPEKISDPRVAGLSESEIETLDRVDASGINSYEVNTTLTSGEYVAQQYLKRTLLAGKKPNKRVIQALTAD